MDFKKLLVFWLSLSSVAEGSKLNPAALNAVTTGSEPGTPGSGSSASTISDPLPPLITPVHGARSLGESEPFLGKYKDLTTYEAKVDPALVEEIMAALENPDEGGDVSAVARDAETVAHKRRDSKSKRLPLFADRNSPASTFDLSTARRDTVWRKGGRHLSAAVENVTIDDLEQDLDSVILNSETGYAVLVVDPNRNLIVQGKIEERPNGTNSTMYTFIQNVGTLDEPRFLITEATSAELTHPDFKDEEDLVPENVNATSASHGRELADARQLTGSDGVRVWIRTFYYAPDVLAVMPNGMNSARAHAAQLVAEHNLYLANSGLSNIVKVVLGQVAALEENERDSYNAILKASALPRLGGDSVTSIHGTFDNCGRGYLFGGYNATPENIRRYLTTVVQYSCASPAKSDAHEWGHTVGFQHNTGSASSIYVNINGRRQEFMPNARAMMDQNAITGTILAYVYDKANRYPAYSSKTGRYNNIPMGSESADNAGAGRITIPQIFNLLRAAGNPPTPRPTRPTTAKPTRKPTTKVPVAKPTVPTRPPIITTYYPTRKPTRKPTKRPTRKPTIRATLAPTSQQRPDLNPGDMVGFTFKNYAAMPQEPLAIIIRDADDDPKKFSRKIVIDARGNLIIKNQSGGNVDPINYNLGPILKSKAWAAIVRSFANPRITSNFQLKNNADTVELFYIPPKSKGKKQPAPQLIVSLKKRADNAQQTVMIRGRINLVPDNNIRFNQVRSIPTKAPTRVRGLQESETATEAEPGEHAVINFSELVANPNVQGKILAKNTELLDLIAADYVTLYKFIIDCMNNFGPYEASKFFENSGVLKELFARASEEDLCNAFYLMDQNYALKSVCAQYIDPNDTVLHENSNISSGLQSRAAVTRETSTLIPPFIWDVAQTRIISKSPQKMYIFLKDPSQPDLQSEVSAYKDLFEFASKESIAATFELFKKLGEQKVFLDTYKAFIPKNKLSTEMLALLDETPEPKPTLRGNKKL
jgi:hypothetical protein